MFYSSDTESVTGKALFPMPHFHLNEVHSVKAVHSFCYHNTCSKILDTQHRMLSSKCILLYFITITFCSNDCISTRKPMAPQKNTEF